MEIETIAPYICLIVTGCLCVLNTIKRGKIYDDDKFAGCFVSIVFANAVNDIINQFYDFHFIWGVAIGFIVYFLLYLLAFHLTNGERSRVQKWEVVKIKVNKRYRIFSAIFFTVGFICTLLICGIIIGGYAIRDYAYVWILAYISLYIIYIGSMKISITEYILDCKPINCIFPKAIPLQFIERTVIKEGKIGKVVIYYDNGKKIVLHPENPKALVEKLKKINRY